jgi:hypothetical protein
MKNDRLYAMPFGSIYPLYLTKVERKGRSKQELDQVIAWLTGYDTKELTGKDMDTTSLKDFFDNAPQLNPNRNLITGVICGVRVEDITEPLMQEIRYMDKVVDELARGKKLESILR